MPSPCPNGDWITTRVGDRNGQYAPDVRFGRISQGNDCLTPGRTSGRAKTAEQRTLARGRARGRARPRVGGARSVQPHPQTAGHRKGHRTQHLGNLDHRCHDDNSDDHDTAETEAGLRPPLHPRAARSRSGLLRCGAGTPQGIRTAFSTGLGACCELRRRHAYRRAQRHSHSGEQAPSSPAAAEEHVARPNRQCAH